MRLLCVLVVVGVAGGVAKEEEGVRLLTLEEIYTLKFKLGGVKEEELQEKTKKSLRPLFEKWEACQGEEDEELCFNGFLFTVTALKEVRSGGELEVLLTLEESLYPNVTFDVSLRSLGDWDFSLDSRPVVKEWWAEEKVLAKKKVTLEVNDLRRVVLKVEDPQWRTAHLIVAPLHREHLLFKKQDYPKIYKITSEVEVFVQTEKDEYAPGDTVNYRTLVVDGNVDKTPKFAQVILITDSEETRLPWMEVPENGIVRGHFIFTEHTDVRVRVTSNVTSSDSSMATTHTLSVYKQRADPSQKMSVRLEGLSDVFFSQPRLKGRVKLTSSDGIPLEGHCHVTIQRWRVQKIAKRSVEVGVAGGEFEIDVVEEAGAVRPKASEYDPLYLEAKCSHVHSRSVGDATETIALWRSLFRVDLLSVETLPLGTNSSHPQATVVLLFLVGRRDGGSVEEEEPTKGLHVKLLLSKDNLGRLRPSATNFSLPIPPNGRVRLEFQVSDTLPANWTDRIRMEVGDAEEKASLTGSPVELSTTIHVTPIDPAQLIRRGDVVRFRLRSCVHYANVSAILSSRKAIYSSRRFSLSPPEGEELDEVIELTIPQNATEGSLLLTVHGISQNPYHRSQKRDLKIASIQLNVVPSYEEQSIRIVDQVDVDMSTVVTFRLEGMLADSVVYLQAAKSDLLEGMAEESEKMERPLRCHVNGYLMEEIGNPEINAQDVLPGAVDPWDLHVTANFEMWRPPPFLPRSLVFIDVDRKTSTMDNGTLLFTKTFDRWTEFGTYVVSGATFNSKSGRTVFSNSPVLRILPPPLTLSVSVPPSVILGETFEVIGYIKNNLATPFEGQVTLDWIEGGSTEVTEHQLEVKPNSLGILKMEVTPRFVGDLFLSLRSNISSRLTVKQKVRVNPSGEVLKVAKHFIVSENRGSFNGTVGPTTFELPINCTPSSEAAHVEFQGDILGDISAFVNKNPNFRTASDIPGVLTSYAKILSSISTFNRAKKNDAALQTTPGSLNKSKLSSNSPNVIFYVGTYGGFYINPTRLKNDLVMLNSMQQADGSFQETATTLNSASDVGVIANTAITLSRVRNIMKWLNLALNASDFTRGVEFLRGRTAGGQVKDNFPLSLVAFLFSQLDDRDTPTFFKKLESTASKDFDGIFWASKWNGKTWSDSLAPSVTATSYALMTYVNMKKLEKADKIARWLVSKKNVNGFYASFEETAVAVRSLSEYATFYASVKREWPSLVKVTQECVTPRKNVSEGEEFSIQAVADEDGRTLRLKICSKEDKLGRLRIMEVSHPSGYRNCNPEEVQGHPIFYLKPPKCKYLKYCRTHKVFSGNSTENSVPTGSVTYYDFFDPLTRSVGTFEAIKNEESFKSLKDDDLKKMSGFGIQSFDVKIEI